MNKFILLSLRSVGSKLVTLTPNDNFDFACYTNKNLMVNVYCVCVFSVFREVKELNEFKEVRDSQKTDFGRHR